MAHVLYARLLVLSARRSVFVLVAPETLPSVGVPAFAIPHALNARHCQAGV
jgi:hypothetical protein